MTTTPYINTELKCSVILHPYQMNNDIYINLKNNLEKKLVGKCYNEYGYVDKIIEIKSYKDGVIEAENIEGSALFMVHFSCKLCIPLKDTNIVCQIKQVNKVLITAYNGPILVVITNDRFNTEAFYKDVNNNIRYKVKDKSHMLEEGIYVVITIQSVRFFNGDENIKAIGFLKEIASDEAIKQSYDSKYSDSNIVDITNYIAE
jgi:DNA-directed RNA polymerase subunit E'/Rpb7